MKFDISLFKLHASCQNLQTQICLESYKVLLDNECIDNNNTIPTNGLYDSRKGVKKAYISNKESLKEFYNTLKQEYSILSKKMTTHERNVYDSQFNAIDECFYGIESGLSFFEIVLDGYKIRLDYYSK